MKFKHSRTTERRNGKTIFVDTITLPPRPGDAAEGYKEYVLLVDVPEGAPFIRITRSALGYTAGMSISRKDLKDILTAVEWADAGPLGRLALEAKPIRRNKYLP